MTKGNIPVIVIAAIFLCLVWTACTQQKNPCLQPTQASLHMETRHYANDTSTVPVDTVLPSALLLSLGTNPLPSLYVSSATFSISLSPASDSCRWLMIPDTTLANSGAPFDTLTFYYQRQLSFLSNACGYTYFYNLQAVKTTNFNIDSVIIENASVSLNANITQLFIYIRRDF